MNYKHLLKLKSKRLLMIILIYLLHSNMYGSDHGEGHIGDFYSFMRGNKFVMIMTVKAELPFD